MTEGKGDQVDGDPFTSFPRDPITGRKREFLAHRKGMVAIHQPNYLPWLGYFNKMRLAERFIVYDSAQYSKNSFGNRNKIRTKEGWTYLTIPIEKEYHFKPFYEVKLPGDGRWREKHWRSIQANYARAAYFESYAQEVERIYLQERLETLAEMNLRFILFFREALGIETEILQSSKLQWDRQKRGTDALVAMLEAVGAKGYLTGSGGSTEYLEQEKFSTIKLHWHRYDHPSYPQVFPGFKPSMAALDALFNLGERARELV